MLLLIAFHEATSFFYYLTIAQILFIPIMLELILPLNRVQKTGILLTQVAVVCMFFTNQMAIIKILASIYFLYTLFIAALGIQRFLQRGFHLLEECLIDLGLVYLAMGGFWFFAYYVKIDTGFPPIITWLTAIHFHYSAFLLCITLGLIGRIIKTKLSMILSCYLAAGPILVALGITFSKWIELLSVGLYVIALFAMTTLLLINKLAKIQGFFIRLGFSTLCFTIIWSFLYALNIVDIPNMLQFHGFWNCFGFAMIIVIGWSFYLPKSNFSSFNIPHSKVTLHSYKQPTLQYHALVDDMSIFDIHKALPNEILRFYEHTSDYSLITSVKWSTWFKPFAYIYQFISKKMGQLNIPFKANAATMDGEIFTIHHHLDAREKPRVWVRSVNGESVFKAIYSIHYNNDKQPYMNIALPLPFATMHGILQLTSTEYTLRLTSDGTGDAGTYLSFRKYFLKLPLHEYFQLSSDGEQLLATHHMKLFNIRFLQINYVIEKASSTDIE